MNLMVSYIRYISWLIKVHIHVYVLLRTLYKPAYLGFWKNRTFGPVALGQYLSLFFLLVGLYNIVYLDLQIMLHTCIPHI